MFDFDVSLDRADTASIKWAGVEPAGERLAMGLADMDFATAPAVVDGLRRRIEHGAFGYTDVTNTALDAVVQWLRERQGLEVRPETVVVSPGVIPSLALLLRGALDPGSGVVVQTPAFSPIPDIVAANGLRVVENPLTLEQGRYEMDIVGLERLLADPSVHALVLCSPHNPVGRVWGAAELERVARLCVAHDVLVVSDEIHADLTYPWSDFVSFGRVAPPGLTHAVLTGPSKAFNLPGLRTSISIVPDSDLRRAFHLERHRINDDFGVATLGVVALEAAYRHGAPWLDALVTYLAGSVDALVEALRGSPVSVIRPDATYLMWIDCREAAVGDAELGRRLSEEGLLVEPGTAFGGGGSGFVRLNIATSRRRVIEAAARLRRVVG